MQNWSTYYKKFFHLSTLSMCCLFLNLEQVFDAKSLHAIQLLTTSTPCSTLNPTAVHEEVDEM